MKEDPTASPDEDKTHEYNLDISPPTKGPHSDILVPPMPVLPPQGASHEENQKYADDMLNWASAKVAHNQDVNRQLHHTDEGGLKSRGDIPTDDKGETEEYKPSISEAEEASMPLSQEGQDSPTDRDKN
ncbi:hypothetical protein C4564_03700 [Candidatus Microgenomates bacterium]|nr:MAG: hypothetical protein C4564_03700 [Candidatus Microgenomates bacterium]